MRPRRPGPSTSGRSGGSDSSSVEGTSSTSAVADDESEPGERTRRANASTTAPATASSTIRLSVARCPVTAWLLWAVGEERSEESTQVDREVKAAGILRVIDVGLEAAVHVEPHAQRARERLIGEQVELEERVRRMETDRSRRRLVVVSPARDRDHVPPRSQPDGFELPHAGDLLVALGRIEGGEECVEPRTQRDARGAVRPARREARHQLLVIEVQRRVLNVVLDGRAVDAPLRLRARRAVVGRAAGPQPRRGTPLLEIATERPVPAVLGLREREDRPA